MSVFPQFPFCESRQESKWPLSGEARQDESFGRDRVRFADEDVRVFISLVLSMQTDGGQCRFQTQIKTNVVMLCFSICLLSVGASESMEVDGLS